MYYDTVKEWENAEITESDLYANTGWEAPQPPVSTGTAAQLDRLAADIAALPRVYSSS